VVLTLFLVRHGQTQYNAHHRLQGWCDSPLTPRGLAGVRATAAHLAGRPFNVAYASPSGRTQTTAHEILAHHPSALTVTDRRTGRVSRSCGPRQPLVALLLGPVAGDGAGGPVDPAGGAADQGG
jgi:probable phosphoglycerate mutase